MDAPHRAANEQAVLALLRADNRRGAEARLRTMLSENPDDARAMALLAHCMLEDRKKKEGLELARAAAQAEPDDPLVRSVLANALQATGRDRKTREEALQLAEDIAAENPEDSDALYGLAIARQNAGADPKLSMRDFHWKLAEARDLFDDAERFARDAHELVNVARLRLGQWDHQAAEALARRAMLLDPTRAVAFRILAECALADKRTEEAYDMALEALRLSPNDAETMRLLVRARTRRSRVMRPFLPVLDWIIEMDRSGLVILPLLMLALGGMLAFSVAYDLERIEVGEAPAIVLSLALAIGLTYALVCYATAVFARWRIRRDLRRVSLPDF
ncbi:MAG: tetratricopeptide repeat protein [Hyphomonadaceae bacterium]